ncbi:MAG TPA: phenylalanine--tRNA ligase subunit beta [Candidatus Paceibacterota bacterium]
MLISYNWLQRYFKKKLPPAEEVAEILTFAIFEVESVEKIADDFVLDVKVLPDRAHYALCHRGIARELAAALTWESDSQVKISQVKTTKLAPLVIKIENPDDCRHYIGRRVEGVKVEPSQNVRDWLKKLLASVGQRSINNIVDASNFVMFDMGQPLHSFDANKVRGAIQIRRAKKGEKMVTLDNKEIVLDPEILIIADDEGPLAIAGVKGGKRAEVINTTKNLILESANFNPILIRKTAQKLNLQTDASKRFENEISPVIAETAMNELSVLITDTAGPKTKFGELVDEYPEPTKPKVIKISPNFVTQKLGVKISEKEINAIMARLDIIKNIIPAERLDLQIPEDLVEEIGRLYGYDKIPTEKLSVNKNKTVANKNYYWESKIRQVLIELGFSEIITSSFRPKGEIEIEKPLASDKAFLRTQLSDQLAISLKLNILNAPLLALKTIKIFEIGKVFPKSGEETHLTLNDFSEAKTVLEKILGEKIAGQINDGILEINLDILIKKLPMPTERLNPSASQSLTFKSFSLYPFIVRDIAVFVPIEITAEKLWVTIEKGIGQEKNLLANYYLFDEYQKADKKSLAFRLIFQAPNRTLTDAETNKIMEKVTTAISQTGWQVR